MERNARHGRRAALGFLIALGALASVWLSLREPRNAAERANTPAPVAELLSAPAPEPAAPESVGAAESTRLLAESEPAGPRDVMLALERFPDHAPIARVLVEVEPRAEEADEIWPATDADGKVRLRVPAAARVLNVRAPGFEPGEAALALGADELRLTLIPSSSLFGRVTHAGASPVAGAEVELVAPTWRVSVTPADERRAKPQSNVQAWQRTVARATTDAEGWYVLDPPTRGGEGTVEVRARLGELDGRLSVALPRAPEALPDLVLGPPPSVLLVRVVDTDGRPIPDAYVISMESPLARGRDRTDARGELMVTAPTLPATFGALAPGFRAHAVRHDGQVVSPSTKVEDPTKLVELVLAPASGARVRIVDAETRMPIYMVRGRCELLANGEIVGRSDFESDREGLAWVLFRDRDPNTTSVTPEFARLTVDEEGYEADQAWELDARASAGPEPIELALRPLPHSRVLRGRVVRDGEPLARFQVGMTVRPRLADPSRKSWQYGRVYTDAEGRFALRWLPAAFEQAVTVCPHWTSWDEFAFLGPLSEDEACAREHVLELHPALHVPALVRGVVRGGSYRYYVSLLEGEGPEALVVPTTINGVPIPCDVDGELRTLLRLPTHRRVQVTIGYASENRLHPDGCAPVEHDPGKSRVPLEFELEPLFLRVRGRVNGLPSDEIPGMAVTLFAAGDPEARRASGLGRLQPDGSFELQGSRGKYELLLVETTPGAWRAVRARQPLELERDVEGLVLVAEPPAAPR